jgi:uncharacterized membrane protein YkvA (DUF1232 family)
MVKYTFHLSNCEDLILLVKGEGYIIGGGITLFRLWRRIKFIFNIRKSVPFLIRFFKSGEVSLGKKWFSVLLLIAYLVFPWDIIPDFLVFLGLVDDLAVFTYIMQWMVKMAPEDLKEEYRVYDE